MKQKFAFFDYDDTLIHGDSGRALLKYYLKKHPLAVFRLLKVAVAFPLSIIGLVKFQTAKSAWLFPMDNLSDEELNVERGVARTRHKCGERILYLLHQLLFYLA